MESKRQFWPFPWQYKESVAFVGGIVAVGFILQLAVGTFDFSLLQWPVNIILGGMMLLFLLLLSFKRKSPFYQWLSGVPMAVTLIGTLVGLGVVMAFIRITSAWPFVLVYFILLLSLGALLIRRLFTFRIKEYTFYLIHIGLWILLFTAGIGAADRKQYVMHVREGEVERRAYGDQNQAIDLPIAVELNDFYMEEYPPKLTVINRETGISQPKNKPEYFPVDEKQPDGRIAGWNISLKQYIHQAIRNSDSTYREVHLPGASPAAKVEISHPQKGMRAEGWVCAGNISHSSQVLNLDKQYCLAMTRPEPKRFVSDIYVYSEDGKRAHTLLEVNKPYKIGHWMLYQYGYDNDAGNLSTYSSIELVYDPWLIPVYVGMILLACGSVCMLWMGNKRKEVCNDVE